MKAQEQVERLKTFQEIFDNLANTYDKLATTSAIGIETELAQGKEALVSAIEYKGGESSADKSLQGIAEDIKEIPNFDQWARLAGVLAGDPATDSLSGHNQNVDAGSITEFTDPLGIITKIREKILNYWDLLISIDLPHITFLPQICNGANSLEKIKCINVKEADYQCLAYLPKLQEIILPSCEKVGDYSFRVCPEVFNIVLGKLTNPGNFVVSSLQKLKNITIGADTDVNLPFAGWNPAAVINEGQSGIDELNNNLYNNLLTKLYDHSEDGQTRTLRLGWLAHVTQENIDYANSKGWTLTT